MFGKRVIRLGDPTTHGGVVVSASSSIEIFGKPVARIGDKVTCPRPGHGVVTIVEGDPTWTDNGKNIALEGHKCSCGCSLISTLPNVGRSYEGSGASSSSSGSGSSGNSVSSTPSFASEFGATAPNEQYDEQTQLISEPIEGVPYFIEASDGRTFSGRVGAQQLLPRIDTESARDYTVFWGDEALARMNGEGT